MPVISFVSSKGGAGKTTSAIIIGTALARNHTVTMIDADEALRVQRWARKDPEAVRHIDIRAQGDEHGIHDAIERSRHRSEYVIIDTKGEASRLNAFIIGESDLVIVPTGEEPAEAEDAIETIADIILQGRALRRAIPYSLLFTRTKPDSFKSRVERRINAQLTERFGCFDVELKRRADFSQLHEDGGTLWDRDPLEAADLDKAIENAEMAAANLKAMVNWLQQPSKDDIRKELTNG